MTEQILLLKAGAQPQPYAHGVSHGRLQAVVYDMLPTVEEETDSGKIPQKPMWHQKTTGSLHTRSLARPPQPVPASLSRAHARNDAHWLSIIQHARMPHTM